MRSFLTAITITLLLSLVSTTDSNSPKWQNRPEKAQAESDSYTGLVVDSIPIFNEYVPSSDFDFDDLRISKRAERKNVHGYYCGSSKHQRIFYEQNYINDAATKACDELGLGSGKKRKYLRPYEATSYSRFKGPYYEYPMRAKHKKKLFAKKRKNKYPNRIIINTECEVVDVVTNDADFHYQQCTRGWH
ncbi:hypothetical protein OnM2_070030 [Erysiphe neolycopersici]|uniref:Secreted effector protein n=1 Tax=Erysiphe neolycopersici TaxID=212602 RepID=A0A420HKR1_9PEZI|nr:hypothetical protein OnM2_070030 [Erysiphe neolycopersici]